MAKKTGAKPSWLVREVAAKDLDALRRLAAHLDSVNLPDDKKALREAIHRARRSFSGEIEDPLRREYMFVLEDESTKRIAGTSMLFAQHGFPEAPHTFFDVIPDERYSSTLDRHFEHIYLRLGFLYNGPTEIGGLVLDPALRGLGLGRVLSYVRFLFIAMYRQRFRANVIAELMPPLTEDGRSELWDHLGLKFTGLRYQEADKLSRVNKEFIISLFPHGPVNASLLPEPVQSLIGQVGPETKGVKKMLEGIGFRYSERIDPFDGGPHYEAKTDDVSLIRESRNPELMRAPLEGQEDLSHALVGVGQRHGPTKFRALATVVRIIGDRIQLPAETQARLRVRAGQRVWTIPL